MKLEERLGANKYYVDETSPHIIVDGAGFGLEEKMKLVNGCPAGLYTLQENGDLAFDFAGCLECGTCRVLCGETIVKTWKYPRNAKGVEFRDVYKRQLQRGIGYVECRIPYLWLGCYE